MWYMNEERKMLQKMVRDFTRKEVRPFIPEMEKDVYPREILRKMGEVGILALCHDKEHGGTGTDWINFGIAIEEIAKESSMMALLTCLASDITIGTIVDVCTPEQIEMFVKPAIKGDILLANWTTEPCGIFNMAEYETTAVRDGDEWVINGGKIFATNGGVCDYGFVMCKTGEFDPATLGGLTWFMVPTNAPGYEAGHDENKLGWKGSGTCQVYFDNVRVPLNHQIGPLNECAPILVTKTILGYCLYGAFTLGSAEGVWEKTRQFLSQRVQGGKSLWDTHQVIRNDMAKLWMKIECFRGAVYQILADRNCGEDTLLRGIALKEEGSKLMEHVAGECMRLHGGTGIVFETGIERYYRDAQMCHVGCGSTKTLTDYLSNFI